jgi:hypothetical protein
MVKVRTVVCYVYLVTRNTWTPVLGKSRQITRARTYDYYLDLDNTVKILGGEWISTQRPDFLLVCNLNLNSICPILYDVPPFYCIPTSLIRKLKRILHIVLDRGTWIRHVQGNTIGAGRN